MDRRKGDAEKLRKKIIKSLEVDAAKCTKITDIYILNCSGGPPGPKMPGLIFFCPSPAPRPVVITLYIEPEMSILPLMTVQLLTPHHSVTVSALVVQAPQIISSPTNLLSRLDLPRKQQGQELKIETTKGKPLSANRQPLSFPLPGHGTAL